MAGALLSEACSHTTEGWAPLLTPSPMGEHVTCSAFGCCGLCCHEPRLADSRSSLSFLLASLGTNSEVELKVKDTLMYFTPPPAPVSDPGGMFQKPQRLGDMVPALWERDSLVAGTWIEDHERPELDVEK